MPFDFSYNADLILNLARQGAVGRMNDKQFIVAELNRFWRSRKFKAMVDGQNYYTGQQDILRKKRQAIGSDGELMEITNLPNNKICDNQYRKMVDQKANYLCGQPISIKCDNTQFVDAVKPYILTRRFAKTLKAVAKDALECGISWLFPYYDEFGNLDLKRIDATEILPMWADADHTKLESAIRCYELAGWEGEVEKVYRKVEVYNPEGIYYFELTDGGTLVAEEPFFQPYFTTVDSDGSEIGYHWDKIPLVAFKVNEEEQPLITRCKGLQDGLNQIQSQWADQMEEDSRNSILVLVNYDGENLGEFRRNLATYGAVKVRSDGSGSGGDVRSLAVTVNAENYKAIVDVFRKAIIENCMGYDAKDDKLGGNPNEMNLKSMYSDIDLDTDDMETEFQASFEELIWFLQCHLANTGAGDFEGIDYELMFKRNVMMSESNIINDCKNSVGILSDETIIAHHPWIDDPDAEIERIKAQKEESMDLYGDFGKTPQKGNSEATEGNEDEEGKEGEDE